MKLGIALSGGGVRGAAHIGILKALEKNNIKPQMISGASAGSIVASLYAMGYRPNEIEEIFLKYKKNLIDFNLKGILAFAGGSLLKMKVGVDGFIKGNKIERLIENFASQKGISKISEIKMPLAISAVDINSSDTMMFTSKKININDDVIYDSSVKISEAVRASVSFPGIFKPKMLKGRRLVDGGVRENVPVRVLEKMGADRILAVNLGYCGEHASQIDNVWEIVSQTIDIMSYSIFKAEARDVDCLLKPRIYNVKLLETDKISECVDRGYNYVKENIETIKAQLKM